jgi:hypothetical protein
LRRFDGESSFPELAQLSLYKRKVRVPDCRDTVEVRYRRTRREQVCLDYGGVRQRKVNAIVTVNGQQAGWLHFNEFEAVPLIDRSQFLQVMDESSHTAEIAEVILEGWEEPFEVTDYGTVVELERVWIKQEFSSPGRLSAICHGILGAATPDSAVLLLKAFPLEFEGGVTELERPAFTRRRNAMMRHYTSALGVAAFAGPLGHEGWMYAISDRVWETVDPPTADGRLSVDAEAEAGNW